MKIDNETLQYALSVLDTQYHYCMDKSTGTNTQKAYYEGLKTMLDIILSDSYKKKCFVGYSDFASLHYVTNNIGNKG